MGNCVGITSTPPPPLPQLEEQPHENTQPRGEDYGHHITNTTFTTPTDTPYIGTPDQMRTGTGTGTGSSSPAGNNAVVSVTLDPRLVSLLDFFRQLYARRNDVFKKIMPVHREAFEDIFKGIVDQENRKTKRLVMQRSNSFGGVESVRPRRFKVKPIEAGGATPQDSASGAGGGGSDVGGGGTTTKPAGGSK